MGMVNDEVTEVLQEQSYEAIKGIIRGKLSSVAESFVSIGYRLKQVRDGEMYKADGYSDIWEFAEKEYSLSQPSTSRFMNINDRYSVDGNSAFLLPQYAGYGWSKLSEMLTLTDEQLKLVSDRTTRVEIREIKKINSDEIEGENEVHAHAHETEESLDNTQSDNNFSEEKKYVFPDAEKLIISFFRPKANREKMKEIAILNMITSTFQFFSEKAAELINPSGHLMFKAVPVILMFEEDHIKYNSFGKPTINYTYQDFFSDVVKIFDMSLEDPWVALYGEPEPDPVPDPVPPKVEQKQETKPEGKKTEPVKDSKPTVKPEEKKIEKVKEEASLPGQIEINDYPELVPEQSEEDSQEEPSWQQDSDSQSEELIINESEEQFEVVEADIVHSHNEKPEYDIDVKYDAETGEIEVLLDSGKGINLIRVIDTGTGESWEVAINQ
jgi:hypothetical protein